MNRKGQTLMISVMVAIMVFMMGTLFLNFLKPEVTTARTTLDCTNTAITDGQKVTCLIVDVVVPYFFLAVISVAGGIITARFLL